MDYCWPSSTIASTCWRWIMLLCDKPWSFFFFNTAYPTLLRRTQKWYPKGRAKLCNVELTFWWKQKRKYLEMVNWKWCHEVLRLLGKTIVEKDETTWWLNKCVVLREGVKDSFSSFSCRILHGLRGWTPLGCWGNEEKTDKQTLGYTPKLRLGGLGSWIETLQHPGSSVCLLYRIEYGVYCIEC